MRSKMRSASGSRKSRSRRNACSRRSRQRGDPQREPADVQPARNAGGQRAFLGGAAGVLVEAGLRDLPERLTFDRLPVPERIGPEVFFSQTYGYPLALVDYTRLGLRDKGALPSLEANS